MTSAAYVQMIEWQLANLRSQQDMVARERAFLAASERRKYISTEKFLESDAACIDKQSALIDLIYAAQQLLPLSVRPS